MKILVAKPGGIFCKQLLLFGCKRSMEAWKKGLVVSGRISGNISSMKDKFFFHVACRLGFDDRSCGAEVKNTWSPLQKNVLELTILLLQLAWWGCNLEDGIQILFRSCGSKLEFYIFE